MKKPKISVIIVYDNETNLYECIQSAAQQSFSNIEIICVNNGSKDNAETIVQNQAEKIDRIKLISMPLGTDNQTAKRAGLAVSQGEFIIFIDNNEIVTPDFVQNSYLLSQKDTITQLKDKYLYNHSFIENEREFSSVIIDLVNEKLIPYENFSEDLRQKILIEFDKFNKNSVENLKITAQDVFVRFDALEKEFYNKDWKNNERMKILENSLQTLIETKFNSLQNEINHIKDVFSKELIKKDNEINSLYNQMEKEIKASQISIEEKSQEAVNKIANGDGGIYDTVNKLEKEIILRYVNLKRIVDLQFDEIKNSLNGG